MQGRTAGDLANADLRFLSIPIAIGTERKDAHRKPLLPYLCVADACALNGKYNQVL